MRAIIFHFVRVKVCYIYVNMPCALVTVEVMLISRTKIRHHFVRKNLWDEVVMAAKVSQTLFVIFYWSLRRCVAVSIHQPRTILQVYNNASL